MKNDILKEGSKVVLYVKDTLHPTFGVEHQLKCLCDFASQHESQIVDFCIIFIPESLFA